MDLADRRSDRIRGKLSRTSYPLSDVWEPLGTLGGTRNLFPKRGILPTIIERIL